MVTMLHIASCVISLFFLHVHTQADSLTCSHRLDLSFAVDSSYSVGTDQFRDSLELVKAVSSRLNVGLQMFRVSLVQFSDAARVEFYLSESVSIDDLVRRLADTNYTEGITQTGAALKLIREDVYTLAHGDRSEVPNVVVIITDGPSSDHDILVNESSLLEQAGVAVIAVSVGFLTHPEELRTMAGQRVLRAKSYAELVNHTDEIMRLICDTTLTTNQFDSVPTTMPPASPALSASITFVEQPTTKRPVSNTAATALVSHTTTQGELFSEENESIGSVSQVSPGAACRGRAADIVVVVDSSNSVGVVNFRKIKMFLTSLVDSFDIGPTKARIGIMIFSDDAKMVIRLEDMTNETDLKDAIQNIQYAGGGSNTAAALKLLGSTAFSHSPRNGGVPQVGVVLTDGLSRNTLLTKLQSERLHAMGVKLFAIGIGSKVSTVELETIGSKPSDHFVVAMADFNALSHNGTNFVTSACKDFPRWRDLLVTTASSYLPTVPATASGINRPGTTSAAANAEEDCVDVHDNCHGFGRDVCSDYEQWARAHCAATCRFCSRNVSEEVCEDNIANCKEYGTYICEDSKYLKWAWDNCAAHCRLCDPTNGITATQLTPLNATDHSNVSETSPTPTTFFDPGCSDTIPDCANHGGPSACVDYHAWASVRCREYCGFCSKFVTVNATIINGIRCPEWKLPVECTMDYSNGACCPMPQCPDDFVLTAKREN